MRKNSCNWTRAVLFLLSFGFASHLEAQSDTWTGANGDWSNAANWSAGVPAANSSVLLGNVATSRTVTFDNPTTTLASLNITQTTSGAAGTANTLYNILSFNVGTATAAPALTVTGAMTLGTTATNAVAEILITGATAGGNFAPLHANGGLTITSGGVLGLAYSSPANSSNVMTGSVTLNGGTINVASPVSGGLTSTLGTNSNSLSTETNTFTFENAASVIALHSIAATAGARLELSGDLNWSAGTLEFINDTSSGNNASLILNGLNNTIGTGAVAETINSSGTVTPVAIPVQLTISLGNPSTGQILDQTLNSSVVLGNVTIREFDTGLNSIYIHTISSTVTGTNIGQVTLTDSGKSNNYFQLGSNLTSSFTSNGAVVTSTNGNTAAVTVLDPYVDLAGYVFDATADPFGWTPDDQTGVATNWDVLSSTAGGVFKAQTFTFTLANSGTNTNGPDSFTVESGVTLQATGGSGTAIVLSANTNTANPTTYSFAATSTFAYTGAASASNPAKLTSGALAYTGGPVVSLGAIQVQNGALLIAQPTLITQGVTVSNGGNLMLNGASATAPTMLTLQSGNFSVTSGTLSLNLQTTSNYSQIFDQSANGTFALTNSSIVLTLGGSFNYGATYNIFSNFTSGTVSNVTITGESAAYTAMLNPMGILSFTAVPEPGSTSLAGAGLFVMLFCYWRWKGTFEGAA